MSDENLNPIIQFKEWFNLAISKEINDPNAMCLSTISSDNKPHSRMVLLKDYNYLTLEWSFSKTITMKVLFFTLITKATKAMI